MESCFKGQDLCTWETTHAPSVGARGDRHRVRQALGTGHVEHALRGGRDLRFGDRGGGRRLGGEVGR